MVCTDQLTALLFYYKVRRFCICVALGGTEPLMVKFADSGGSKKKQGEGETQ